MTALSGTSGSGRRPSRSPRVAFAAITTTAVPRSEVNIKEFARRDGYSEERGEMMSTTIVAGSTALIVLVLVDAFPLP